MIGIISIVILIGVADYLCEIYDWPKYPDPDKSIFDDYD